MTSRRWTIVRRDLVLVALGAAAAGLASPPTDLWPVGLVVWVPLAAIVATSSPRRAGGLGWLQGCIAQSIVLAGLPSALRESGGMSHPLSMALGALLVVWEGARFGVIGAIAARAVAKGWPLVLAFPVTLVAVEWFYPMFFPWNTPLFFQGTPVLLQGAELGGPLVLSAWAGFLDGSLATALKRGSDARALVTYGFGLPVATLAIVLAGGALRMDQITRRAATAPALRVGIVQGNRSSARDETDDSAVVYREASLDLLRREKVDLLIWPEAAISSAIDAADLPQFFSERLLRTKTPDKAEARIDVALLTGMVIARLPPEGAAHIRQRNSDGTWRRVAPHYFNSAVLSSADGRIAGSYDKRTLVPLGEYIPFEAELPWLRRWIPSAGHFSAGSSASAIPFGNRRIAILICYEDILAEGVREAVDATTPDLLVNLTSDSWFGASRVPALHLALARLRAVEHRRYLVHATNTGMTATVDPTGRVVGELVPHRRASAAVTVRWMQSQTVYERIGDPPWAIFAGLAVLMALRGPRRGRSSDVRSVPQKRPPI